MWEEIKAFDLFNIIELSNCIDLLLKLKGRFIFHAKVFEIDSNKGGLA